MKKLILILFTIINVSNVAFADSIESSVATAKPQHKVKKHRKAPTPITVKDTYFINSTFDFTYDGDVSGITAALQAYDPSVKIYPSLGKIASYPINLDLQHTDLVGIQSFIATKTNNRAKLQYDVSTNSLRLIYDTKITVATDAVRESLKWQSGETPSPVLSKYGLVLFPYGQYEPKITCQPLQLCDIQLEASEVVKSAVIGDSVQWNQGDGAIPIVYSGSDVTPTPHIVLKPVRGGLDTTLLVTTDKRTYYIKLLSSDSVSVSRAGFYYPGEEIQQLEQKRNNLVSEDDKKLSDNKVDPKNLHFDYKISGDTDAPFNPVQVFDDGIQVYIQMPDDLSSKNVPAFYALSTDGYTRNLVNFRYKKPFFVVDKVFDSGLLVYGRDDNEQSIKITRVQNKGFWSRLFGG